MDLLLWRHAEAEDIADEGDLARVLTPKGRLQADAMAKWLKRHGPQDSRILVSPALRTQQTAQAFSKHFETCAAIAPSASVSDLLKASGWPKGLAGSAAVIVVGHQPTLGQVAAKLISGREAGWSVKKGALWWLQRRVRGEHEETILKLVMSADLA